MPYNNIYTRERAEAEYMWDMQDWTLLKEHQSMPVEKLKVINRKNDLDMLSKSTRYQLYSEIKKQEKEVPYYIRCRLPNNIMKCIAQCRLGNGSFWFSGTNEQLENNNICLNCNMQELDTPQHLFLKCKLHEGKRRRSLPDNGQPPT